jgi:Holliday junction resolvase
VGMRDRMGKINSKNKGKRGELEWAKWLRDNGCPDARRGQQYAGGSESPDVVGGIGGLHFEVKRTEQIRLVEAIEQAKNDAGNSKVPVVVWRKNNYPWYLIIPADRLFDTADVVIQHRKENE